MSYCTKRLLDLTWLDLSENSPFNISGYIILVLWSKFKLGCVYDTNLITTDLRYNVRCRRQTMMYEDSDESVPTSKLQSLTSDAESRLCSRTCGLLARRYRRQMLAACDKSCCCCCCCCAYDVTLSWTRDARTGEIQQLGSWSNLTRMQACRLCRQRYYNHSVSWTVGGAIQE